ncbi:MAG: hypothetical protein MK142_09210 [Pseudomonadales bacterium]|nr:hypothetical protein [Pseudomonadales bacterium]
MNASDAIEIDRVPGRGRARPLWVAGGGSLVLHAALAILWFDQAPAPIAVEVRSLDVQLSSITAPAPGPGPGPGPGPEPEPEPVEVPIEEMPVPDPAPPQDPVRAPAPASASAYVPESTQIIALPEVMPLPGRTEPSRVPLRLGLPPPFREGATDIEGRSELFDSRLSRELEDARRAQVARRSARPLTRAPQVWAGAGEGRMRIESDLGCFERIRDSFDDQPGAQWWLVDCGDRGEQIDWGARFRGEQ